MTLALAQRRGMALPLVMVLVTLAGIAIFVFQRVVQQEAYGTHKLVRTLQAEAICDRVVNRLSAVVGQHPWEDRFYLLDAMAKAPGASTMPEAKYVYDQDHFPFGDEGPEFASGDASFTGSIKDTSALDQRYRITVKAKYKGVSVLGVYDLTHARGTMGPLNRSAVDLRVMKVDEAPLDAQIDQEMDAIPVEAARPENVLGPNVPVPSIPAVFPPAGAAAAPSAAEQTAGLVGGKLVPAFNPPAGVAPGTPQATRIATATATATQKASGRGQSDFDRTRAGTLPPGSVLQPGAPVPAPKRPGAPASAGTPAAAGGADPNADPFAADPGSLGNDGGTYTPAGWDPSLGAESYEPSPDGTEAAPDGGSFGTEPGGASEEPGAGSEPDPYTGYDPEQSEPQSDDGTEKAADPGSQDEDPNYDPGSGGGEPGGASAGSSGAEPAGDSGSGGSEPGDGGGESQPAEAAPEPAPEEPAPEAPQEI